MLEIKTPQKLTSSTMNIQNNRRVGKTSEHLISFHKFEIEYTLILNCTDRQLLLPIKDPGTVDISIYYILTATFDSSG